jgi:hypothetical protein
MATRRETQATPRLFGLAWAAGIHLTVCCRCRARSRSRVDVTRGRDETPSSSAPVRPHRGQRSRKCDKSEETATTDGLRSGQTSRRPRRPNGDRSADQNGDDFDRGRQYRLQHHQVHFERMLAGERPRIGQDRDVKAKSRRIAREWTICEGSIGQRYARNMIFLRSSSNPNVISSRFSTSGSGSSRPRRNNRRF